MTLDKRPLFPFAQGSQKPIDAVTRAVFALRRGVGGLVALSAVFNLFMLTGSLFMLQVYDRVLTSGSIATLVALLALVTGIYACLAGLETIRLRASTRMADWFGDEIGPSVVRLTIGGANHNGHATNLMQDYDRLRGFVGSPAAIALCDLPWLPLYLLVAFLFHVSLGFLALAGVVVLFGLAALSDRLAQAPVALANAAAARRARVVDTAARSGETILGLGMRGAYLQRYGQADADLRLAGRDAADRTALFVGLSRGIRLFLQSASLALGAYLALRHEITAGMIIAVSIVTSRALAPVEQAIGHWRQLVSARQSWARLSAALANPGNELPQTQLPGPNRSLEVFDLAVAAPVSGKILLSGVTFSLNAGSCLGIIGPSGAGKSTLARALVGVLPPARGSIRLDGAELSRWDPDDLGRHIGYLPQDIELFDGTVAENIARLATGPHSPAVLEAARKAGAHALISGLPDGYDTLLGAGGITLSAGQRQRIGLARALFGSPFLIVLDEPSSNVDMAGDEALTGAVEAAKRAMSIPIVIAHRPSTISACDHVLVIANGRQTAFGPRERILSDTGQRAVRVAAS